MSEFNRVPRGATNPDPRRVAVYCRVSSAGQEDNSSLETQEAACRAYAAERGWAVVSVHREVHSGADLFGRPQLTALREVVRSGQVGVVLAHALDRVSRNQAHLGFLLSEWDHQGARLELVTEELTDTPEGRLLQSVRGFVAEMERLKIAERTQRGIRQRVESGKLIPGQKPLFGYRWRDESKSAYDLDPEAAPVVRRIFDLALAGEPIRAIARTLTAEGVPTPTGRRKLWEPPTVHHVLRHPAYTGRAAALRYRYPTDESRKRQPLPSRMMRPEEEQIELPEGTIPAIVTADEQIAVLGRLEANRALAARNNRNPEANLLRSGIVRCGYCGLTMIVDRKAARSDRYRCNPRNADRHGCPGIKIDADMLDREVWGRVVGVLTNPGVIAAEVARQRSTDTSGADVAALDRRLLEIERQRSNLARSLALFDDEETSAPVMAELRALTAQAKVLVAERALLAHRAAESERDRGRLQSLAGWCDRVAGNLAHLSYSEKRMVLDALGVRVKVYRADHDPRWEMTMEPLPLNPVPNGIAYTSTAG